MKRNKISLKWKVFLSFSVFTAAIICLLWLFQTVFLEDFYKLIKTGSIYSSASALVKNLEDDNLDAVVENLSQSQDICIRVVTQDGVDISSSNITHNCTIHKMGTAKLAELYLRALSNGGEYIERLARKQEWTITTEDHFLGQFSEISPPRELESIVYVKLAQRGGSEAMILLNTMISPVDATVQTIRVQLFWISIILILLALILSLFIARSVSKPIEQINQAAKSLAEGKYEIAFPDNGYKEVAELGQTLNYAAEELAKTENLRRELIANVSHDLRTPLTMITGYGEVMRDLPGENTPENVQIIIDEATRLTQLVNDMLDLSKLQSGTQTLNCTVFSLTQAVKTTLERYHKLIEHEGYQIDFQYQEDIWVNADELRISQVIYNLVNNAIAYTGADKKVTVIQTVHDGNVRISVKDTGEGIDSEMLPLIWDRYYKVDKAHKRAIIGTGLGLSIVKSTMNLHGGTCGVTSEKGNGSIFWFELKMIAK